MCNSKFCGILEKNSNLSLLCSPPLSLSLFLQILSLPSKLFYNNHLICRAQFQPDGPKHIQPLQFVGVDGQERQDSDSPSYYNDDEVSKIVEEVR